MTSTGLEVNQKGDEVMSRHYRNDIHKSAFDAFRSKIIAKKTTGQTAPIILIEGVSFAYIRHSNIFIVAATKGNPNTMMLLEFLLQKLQILKSYLGDNFNDDSVQSSFTLIFELFDETMDYGFPQNCAIDVLRLYINLGSTLQNATIGSAGAALTSQITGAIDWRREGIRYKKNEVLIDVQETVTLMISATGQVLRSEISGKVMMKTSLTGMPECKFGLNDKLTMEKEGGAAAAAAMNKASGVELDDCTFHRCVRLGKFDSERTITFIPPDGEFELMKYRVSTSSHTFRLFPNIDESKSKLIVNLKVVADFPDAHKANVIIRIPVPQSTTSSRITVGRGRCKYEPAERALLWRISSFPGQTESNLVAVIDLLPATREKVWVKPPISVDFQIPMFLSSGVQVRFLKVYEKSYYKTHTRVRSLSKSGDYQMRLL